MEAELSARTPRYRGEGAGERAPYATIGNTLGLLYPLSHCDNSALVMPFKSLGLLLSLLWAVWFYSPSTWPAKRLTLCGA